MPRPLYGWDDRDSDLWSALRQLPSYGLIANDKDNPMVSRKEVIALLERAAKQRGLAAQTAQPSDMERLDWLFRQPKEFRFYAPVNGHGVRIYVGDRFVSEGDTERQAIDAAMQAGKEEHAGNND